MGQICGTERLFLVCVEILGIQFVLTINRHWSQRGFLDWWGWWQKGSWREAGVEIGWLTLEFDASFFMRRLQ